MCAHQVNLCFEIFEPESARINCSLRWNHSPHVLCLYETYSASIMCVCVFIHKHIKSHFVSSVIPYHF